MSVLKSLAVWAVSRGLRLPEASLDRVIELTFLRRLLRQLRIDCVLDVGANRGQFAAELRGIGYRGHIVSFEPISSEFQALERRFNGDPKWIGYQCALGSAAAEMPLTVPRLSVMSSFLEAQVTDAMARTEMVSVKRLDELMAELPVKMANTRIFLKMDTQGFDLEVFRGASGCMDAIRGLQSELSVKPIYKNMPHYLEALARYEEAGFDLYNVSVVNRVEGGGLLELNCFMRRAR